MEIFTIAIAVIGCVTGVYGAVTARAAHRVSLESNDVEWEFTTNTSGMPTAVIHTGTDTAYQAWLCAYINNRPVHETTPRNITPGKLINLNLPDELTTPDTDDRIDITIHARIRWTTRHGRQCKAKIGPQRYRQTGTLWYPVPETKLASISVLPVRRCRA